MTAIHFGMALLCVLAISIGQILFKRTGLQIESTGSVFAAQVLLTGIGAMVLYAGASLLWIYLLRFVELRYAYPIMALSFVITPLLAHLFLSEKIGGQYLFGMALIIAGIVIITRTAASS